MTLKYNINKLENIKNYINESLNNDLEDIKQKGQVFTPFEIIEYMVNTFEKQYNKNNKIKLFEDENIKWLDNSVGCGNFMLYIYYKLLIGLKIKIPNFINRKRHILENMLYMVDIDEKTINKCKEIFNNSKYKMNIQCGNSITLNYKDTFLCDKYDIIIGNPPYQKNNNKNNRARGGINNNLYLDFINFNLELLKHNGYLVYIHPQNWRKIDEPILNKFLNRNLIHLSLNYGSRLFKTVSVNTDFYILKNNTTIKLETDIINYDDKNNIISQININIPKINFLPNIITENLINIINKINTYGENRICLINSDCHKVRKHVNKGKTEIFKYALYNTSGNPYLYFSSRPHKDQYKNKIIMSCSGKLKPFYDEGTLGTTQDSMYFLVNNKKEGLFLVNILNSSLYTYLLKVCSWSNFRNEPKLLSYLKYPKYNEVDNIIINDDYISKYFNLTKSEIEIIKK